jgi:ATP-binding cassette subfamily B protein
MLLLNFIEMGSILTLAPLIDLITKPTLEGTSSITIRLFGLLERVNLPTTIYSVMILILCFTFLRVIVSILVYKKVLKIKYALAKDMICNTYERFFDAGWNFFVTNSHGTLGNTFIKEINRVGDSFGHMGLLFVTLFRVIFYFIVAFYISWRLSLVIILVTIIISWPFSLLGSLTYKLGKINLETANRIFEIIQENLAAAKIIIGFGEQKRGVQSLEKAVDDHVNSNIKSQVVENSIPIVFQAVGIGLLLLSIFLSQTFIKISLSELTVILYSFYLAVPLAGQLLASKNAMLNFFPSYEQVNRLRSLAEKEVQPSGSNLFDHFEHQIVLNNVNFSYPKHDLLLRDINVIIPKGKMIAFVGKSGAGKSTLIDLLLRFYEPDSGVILVDGIDLRELDVLSWRHRIGYVPQDSILFNMSVRDNLKWAEDDATDDDIIHACKLANVDDFIDDLSNGLDTIVGDRGVRLSGGQRQRVALARAILRRPELLILDEATSSLDSHSEKLIQDAVENISHETTIVVVAHRLSTIINADYIYVIDNGIVIEEGTFAELYAQRGRCYELAKIQGIA